MFHTTNQKRYGKKKRFPENHLKTKKSPHVPVTVSRVAAPASAKLLFSEGWSWSTLSWIPKKWSTHQTHEKMGTTVMIPNIYTGRTHYKRRHRKMPVTCNIYNTVRFAKNRTNAAVVGVAYRYFLGGAWACLSVNFWLNWGVRIKNIGSPSSRFNKIALEPVKNCNVQNLQTLSLKHLRWVWAFHHLWKQSYLHGLTWYKPTFQETRSESIAKQSPLINHHFKTTTHDERMDNVLMLQVPMLRQPREIWLNFYHACQKNSNLG